VTDPNGTPHPPGKDSPKDRARRGFKQDIDGVVRMFMRDHETIDWSGLYATTDGRADLLLRMAEYLRSRAKPHHMKELV
jgi:hypothetical protein